MNTILILTAKSRAAEVTRDKKTLKRARTMNAGIHFENAGDTAARLIAGLEPMKMKEQLRRVKFAKVTGTRVIGSPSSVAREWKLFEKLPDGTWRKSPLTPRQVNREMAAVRRGV